MPAAAGKVYVTGDVEIDTGQVVIRRAGEERSVRPKAFRLLAYLVENRNRLVPKEELIQHLWPDVAVSDGALVQCIADIRRALDEDSRNPKFIRTAARLGYQFIAPLDEKCAELVTFEEITEERVEYSKEIIEEDEPALDLHPAPLLPEARVRNWRRFAVPIVLAGLAVAAALAAWNFRPGPSPWKMEAGIRTAIVEFENRSDRKDMDWLRAGLADMLATSLSESPRIALITPGQLQRELRQPGGGLMRREDLLRAARQTGAKAMITGAFASLGDTIRVDAQIYDVSTGRLVGGESLTVDKPALLLAQLDPLAIKLATRLGAPFAGQHLAEVTTDNLEAYRLYSLGLARARNFRLAEAIELYQKAVALDPGFAMAYARIGFTYASTWARPTEGKPYLEKAYTLSDRLTPRDRLFIRGWYAVACQDYEGAERAYRELLSAFPLEAEAYQALGTLILHDRRYDEARRIFERGLAVEPDMPQLYNQLSGAYFELGKNQQAVESAQRYVSLSGEANAYDSLALAYHRVGQYGKARETFLEAIHRNPGFDLTLFHLGNLYFQLGRYREALGQYREFIRLAQSDIERCRGHLAASWVYWKKGDLADAGRETAEATRMNGGRTPRESLAIQADHGGVTLTSDLRRTILSRSASRGGPENQRIPYFVAGYIALRDHQTKEALEHFRVAQGEPPVYWFIDPLETCLADALLELGRFDEAIAEYRRVLSANPNYPMARYRLGIALERTGMRTEARAEFERFLEIWKNADADIPELVDARRRVTP
jgi:tetratricopeptide (TPR) repeat protein